MRFPGCLLPFLLIPTATVAQFQLMTFAGRIIDPVTGVALSSAEVHVHDVSGRDEIRTRTDSSNGAFRISITPLGRYTIRFTSPGRIGAFLIAELSANEYWKGIPNTEWTVAMDLGLDTLTEATSADRFLGTMLFNTAKNVPEWVERDARASFPITTDHESREARYRSYRDILETRGAIVIRGTVVDHWDRHPLEGVEVRVTHSGGDIKLLHTDTAGFYAVVIGFEPATFTWSAPGLVSKSVVIDGSDAPADDRNGGFGMVIDIKLFEPIPGADLSFLEAPMGRAAYNARSGNMSWDMEYTQPIIDRLNSVLLKGQPAR